MRSAALLFLVAAWAGAMPATAGTSRAGAPEPAGAWAAWARDEAAREPLSGFPWETCVRQAAARNDLPLSLLVAVARGESNFDPRAVSSANARGVMQILWPGTARHLGLVSLDELEDPCTNIDAGARYLRELLDHYDGDLHRALAAYNYGPGRVPADGGRVPGGAAWYSGYILRHLRYVLGDSGPAGFPGYGAGQLELAVFAAPYRAEAFLETLQLAAPALRLDWFRQDVASYRVVLLYEDVGELETGRRLLAVAGFPVEKGSR